MISREVLRGRRSSCREARPWRAVCRGVVSVSIGDRRIPGGRFTDAHEQACTMTVAAERSTTRRRVRAFHACFAEGALGLDRVTAARPGARRGRPASPRRASANDSACCALGPEAPDIERGCPTHDQGGVVFGDQGRHRLELSRRLAHVDRAHRDGEAPLGVRDRDPDACVAEIEAEHPPGRRRGRSGSAGARHVSAAPRSSSRRAGIPPSASSTRSACLPPALARMSFPPAPPPITPAAVSNSAGAVTPRPPPEP